MSQLTFDSFQLDFIDENISILIPENEDLQLDEQLNLLHFQESIPAQFNSLNNDAQSINTNISPSKISSQCDNTGISCSNKSPSEILHHASNTTNLTSPSNNSLNIAIAIPKDNHDFSAMLDLDPNQFNNKIKSFINDFDNSPELLDDVYKQLELTEQHLLRPSPVTCGFERTVTIMDLSKKHLSSLNVEEFTVLQSLNASHNELNCIQLPKSIISLNLSHNNFSNYHFVVKLPFLDNLNLDHNECSEIIQHDCLSTLSLNHNNVSSFPDVVMASLCVLNLNFNKFRTLSNLHSFPNLSTLNITNNQIENIELSENISLNVLDLKFNNLSHFDGYYFDLNELHLDNNNIDYITNCKSKCISVSSQLTKKVNLLNSVNCTLFYAKNVKLLNKSMIADTLVELHLEHCHVNRISSATVRRLRLLEVLNLNNNNISDVQPICNFTRLQVLKLAGNRIKSFTMVLGLLSTTLKELDLRQNILTASYYSNVEGAEEDHEYIKNVNDAVYVQRLCYRASIVFKSKLNKLDGLIISDHDRENAERILMKLKSLNKYRI
eukprot:NODE_133_length_18153_cov_0.298050.p2 type:complete len:551 gc:universal NODE_133_length_18153_cov_0.298050:12535-14187(+)